jgi:hypothetical protein
MARQVITFLDEHRTVMCFGMEEDGKAKARAAAAMKLAVLYYMKVRQGNSSAPFPMPKGNLYMLVQLIYFYLPRQQMDWLYNNFRNIFENTIGKWGVNLRAETLIEIASEG